MSKFSASELTTCTDPWRVCVGVLEMSSVPYGCVAPLNGLSYYGDWITLVIIKKKPSD